MQFESYTWRWLTRMGVLRSFMSIKRRPAEYCIQETYATLSSGPTVSRPKLTIQHKLTHSLKIKIFVSQISYRLFQRLIYLWKCLKYSYNWIEIIVNRNGDWFQQRWIWHCFIYYKLAKTKNFANKFILTTEKACA